MSLMHQHSTSAAMARLNQPAETCQQNHCEELQEQIWLHQLSFPTVGRGWEDPRGRGRMVPPSSPSPSLLPRTAGTISLSLRSLFPLNRAGGARRKEKGRWWVLVPRRGGWDGCKASRSRRSHAEPRCSHVHQRVSALTGLGGEYWISLWSGLNL